MHVKSIAAVCLTVGALVGCDDPVAPASDVLTAAGASFPGVLRLESRTGEPVFYFVAEREALASLDWVLCTNPACPAVAARGEVSIPYGRIAGYRSGAREVVVFHWRLRPLPGGYAADSVRALVVPL